MKRPLGFLLVFLLAALGARAAAVPKTLTLRQCLALALEHNPDLRIASTQFLAAEGRAVQLHAILYPTVDAQALSTPLIFYVQIQETFYSRATLPQLRLSRLTHEQAFLNYRQTLIDVAFQVRQAFTTALGAQEQVALDRDLIASRQSAYKTAQDLFTAGHLQRGNVLPIQVLAQLARQSETLATLTEQQGVLALAQVIGVDLPDTVKLVGNLDDHGPAQLDVGALSAQALHDRQDLQLLENARLSAEQQIQIDLKNAWPTVGFESDSAIQPPSFLPDGASGYDLERNYDEPETQRVAGDTQLPLSLYLNWTIFDGGNLIGVKRAEKAQIATQEVAIDALKRACRPSNPSAPPCISLVTNRRPRASRRMRTSITKPVAYACSTK
jgi:outer membrane protein TolC